MIKRFIILGVIVVGGIGGYFIFSGNSPLRIWWLVRSQLNCKEVPVLCSVPEENEIVAFQKREGTTKISSSQFTFEVPWSGRMEKKENASAEIYSFPDTKHFVLISKPGTTVRFTEKIEENKDLTPEERRKLFGDELESEYIFTQAALNITPDDVRLFSPYLSLVKNFVLLTYKGLISFSPPILSFDTGSIRGFQFGESGRMILFFDSRDEKHEINLGGSVTEEEVEWVISSIQVR